MSAASDYLEFQLLRVFDGVNLVAPAGFFVALHTADPTDQALGGTEVTTAAWPAYVRQSVGALGSAWSTPSSEAGGGHRTANQNSIEFSAFDGAGTITITHYSIWDAETGGNMWVHGALTASKTLDPQDAFAAQPGYLAIILR